MAATYLPTSSSAGPAHVNSNPNLASNSAAASSHTHLPASVAFSSSSHFDVNNAAYESTALSSYTPSLAPASASPGSTIPVSRASPLDQLVRRTSSRRTRTVAAARDREAFFQMNQQRVEEEQGASNPSEHIYASHNDTHQSLSLSITEQLPTSTSLSTKLAPLGQRLQTSIDNSSSSNKLSVAYNEYSEDEYEYNYEDYYGTSDSDGDAHQFQEVSEGLSSGHISSEDTGTVNGVNEQDAYAYLPTPLAGDRPSSAAGPQLAQYTYSHRGRSSYSHLESTHGTSTPPSINPTITISPTLSQSVVPGRQDSVSEADVHSAHPITGPSSMAQSTRTPRLGVPPSINTSDLSSNNYNPRSSALPSPLLHSSFAFRRGHVDSVISSSDHDTDADYSRDYSRQKSRGSLATLNSSPDEGRTTNSLNAFQLSVGDGLGSPNSSRDMQGDKGATAQLHDSDVYWRQGQPTAAPPLRGLWNSDGSVAPADPSPVYGAFNALDHDQNVVDPGINDERVGAVSSVRTPDEARVEREAGGLIVKATQGGLARPVAEEALFVHGQHMGERVTVQLPEDMREGKMKVLERLAQQQQQVGKPPQVLSASASLRPEHAVVNRHQAQSELYSQYSYYSYQSPVPSPRSETFSNEKSRSSPSPKSVAFAHSSPATPVVGPTTPEEYLQQGIRHHEANRLQESARCFERSAIEGGGCGVGMLMYGLTLRHGWGCRKNESMGFKWLMKAAEHAVSDLEHVRISGGEAGVVGGVQTELVLAIYEVGQCFFHGWGVQKDTKMGVSYYQVAARLGDGDAQNDLAFCLANGKGCKKDKKSAAKWYRAAVAQGQSDVGLAWIYKEKYQ